MCSPPSVITRAQLGPKHILCGKGKHVVKHTANKHYREKCASKRNEYNAAPNKITEKQKVSKKVYEELKADGYAFVRPVADTRNTYVVIDETDTEKKVLLGMIRQCIMDSNKRTYTDSISASVTLSATSNKDCGAYNSMCPSECTPKESEGKRFIYSCGNSTTSTVKKAWGTQFCTSSRTIIPCSNSSMAFLSCSRRPDDEPTGCMGKMLEPDEASHEDGAVAIAAVLMDENQNQFLEFDADVDFQQTSADFEVDDTDTELLQTLSELFPDS